MKRTIFPYLNKRARFKYQLLNRLEAGLVLKGSEIKLLIKGEFDITNAFCLISKKQEIYLENFIIGNKKRSIKLLLKKREILNLDLKKQQLKATIVPLKLYFKYSKLKLEITIGRGKKIYDKKKVLIERELKKESNKAKKKLFFNSYII